VLAPLHPVAVSLQPWAEAGWRECGRLAAPLHASAAPRLAHAAGWLDARLAPLAPWEVGPGAAAPPPPPAARARAGSRLSAARPRLRPARCRPALLAPLAGRPASLTGRCVQASPDPLTPCLHKKPVPRLMPRLFPRAAQVALLTLLLTNCCVPSSLACSRVLSPGLCACAAQVALATLLLAPHTQPHALRPIP